MQTAAIQDSHFAAVAARDRQAAFFYAVRTTGVYCRPSCGARLPRPENTRFYATAAAAEAAGYRPCKRCKPSQPAVSCEGKIAAACRRIEAAETPPSLAALAQAAGLSTFHFHRLFKAATGVTPKAYAAAHRADRLRDGLPKAGTVTQAIYDAGFNSAGRFYATATARLGMTPKNFRAGGPDTNIRYATGLCSLGAILVAASQAGICAIALGDDAGALVAALRARFDAARLDDGDAEFAALVARVIALVDSPAADPGLPLDIRGTAFQVKVWQALQAIPAGRTATYGDIARAIGAPKAARAVAAACAANTLAVAIPCHRAVRAGGALAGYRWGLARKRRLLQEEAGNGP